MAARKAAMTMKAAQEKIAALDKDLTHEKSMRKYADDRSSECRVELDAVHSILDLMPGALPKKKDEYYTNKADLRLASFLASKL